MIRKFLCSLLFLSLAGCGAQTPSWDNRAQTPGQAQSAPSRLVKTEAAAEQPVYVPYASSAQSAEIYRYDETAQPPVQKSSAYAAALAQQARTGQQNVSQDSAGLEAPSQQPDRAAADQYLPPVKVALLLPLSGSQADLGQGMLQAAQLALFDMGYSSFELMPRDTKVSPQDAVQAAQSAIDDGAQLILGPVFADAVRAVKPLAERRNINMIAFSTDWSLAGGNTFIMGFLPFTQVERVTSYAAAQGYTKMGILAPNSDYGSAVVAAYNSFAYRAGLGTADVARYAPEAGDPSEIVKNFTKYDERVAAAAVGAQGNTPVSLPFQAVLLPVGGDQARAAANLLSYYDLGPRDVKRLGTGLWDDRSLASEPALEGAWFAAPSPDLRRDFEKNYRNLYGARPPRLSSLAYDATALAAVLARKSYRETGRARFERADLLNPNGFAGVDGIFRFRPDGLVERGLAVLEFRDSSIKVIDPAPSTFQRAGY